MNAAIKKKGKTIRVALEQHQSSKHTQMLLEDVCVYVSSTRPLLTSLHSQSSFVILILRHVISLCPNFLSQPRMVNYWLAQKLLSWFWLHSIVSLAPTPRGTRKKKPNQTHHHWL